MTRFVLSLGVVAECLRANMRESREDIIKVRMCPARIDERSNLRNRFATFFGKKKTKMKVISNAIDFKKGLTTSNLAYPNRSKIFVDRPLLRYYIIK